MWILIILACVGLWLAFGMSFVMAIAYLVGGVFFLWVFVELAYSGGKKALQFFDAIGKGVLYVCKWLDKMLD